jgi:poly [ADP-ribose] polymerase
MTTATITEQQKLVLASADANSNKFWEYQIYSDNTIVYNWGRVGTAGQTSGREALHRSKHDRKVSEKLGKGYKPLNVLAATGPSGPAPAKTAVTQAAVRDIAGANPVLKNLVERLAQANKHELSIASGGQLNLDLSTGLVSTPLGVVTKNNINQARVILSDLAPYVDKQKFDDTVFKSGLSEYLMLVPQRVAHRAWHLSFMPDAGAVTRQVQLLDQLDASIEIVEKRIDDAKKAALAPGNVTRDFEVQLEELQDAKEWDRLVKKYTSNVNRSHQCAHLKPKRAFKVRIPHMYEGFQQDGAKLQNQMELWHGTRIFNVLSIMQRGLVMPKALPTQAYCGAMFSHGLYFSDQSSKSLNYAFGYWDGHNRDNNCFMFVVDVGMGNYYVPPGPTQAPPPKGYDSYFAQGGKSGVMNNEMIVFRLGQANIKYLMEFEG